MSLRELVEEYSMTRRFATALESGDAELAIKDADGVTILSDIFPEYDGAEKICKDLELYSIELVSMIRQALDDEEKALLSHPSLPEYERIEVADHTLGIPKNDHRRCGSEDDMK